jgi:hypothetical protein
MTPKLLNKSIQCGQHFSILLGPIFDRQDNIFGGTWVLERRLWRTLGSWIKNCSVPRNVKGIDYNVDDIKYPIEAIIKDIMGNLTKK